MKKIFLSYITACMLLACTNKQTMDVNGSQPIVIERSREMVERTMSEISNQQKLADDAQSVVLNAAGTAIPHKITIDDKVIFPTK